MNIRQRVGRRYALTSAVCVLLLMGLVYHEFFIEPEILGQSDSLAHFKNYTRFELVLHLVVPAVLMAGWWLMASTLRRIEDFAQHVEQVHCQNLHIAVSANGSGDELDRLATVFNEMVERLGQSFRLMHEFTLNASHELKTPLSIMSAQLQTMLGETSAWSGQQQEGLRAQLEEVLRLARTVDALTFISKADSGLLSMTRQSVNVEELLLEAVDDASVLAEPSHIRVSLVSCEPASLIGDRDRLRQVLLNLADNAIKYNVPGGAVKFDLRKIHGSAVICVANTGPGIAPQLESRIFNRFARGTDALERGIEGCGLGLAICQRIVQAHGGLLSISTQTDGWTVARVVLPLHPSLASVSSSAVSVAPPAGG